VPDSAAGVESDGTEIPTTEACGSALLALACAAAGQDGAQYLRLCALAAL
jgi:hypothetical protein